MNRPRLLDLFCGAGGAAVGYHRAGFDVVGVDIAPQPRYPFEFHQADAIEYLAENWAGFDAVHASPPCQDWSKFGKRWSAGRGTGVLLPIIRLMLNGTEMPWVIENVPGSAMRPDLRLCGCYFDLPGLRRERWFETSWRAFDLANSHSHTDRTITVAGNTGGSSTRDGAQGFGSLADWKLAMGIDWMTAKELAQAIPPAYAEHVGGLLAEQIGRAAA